MLHSCWKRLFFLVMLKGVGCQLSRANQQWRLRGHFRCDGAKIYGVCCCKPPAEYTTFFYDFNLLQVVKASPKTWSHTLVMVRDWSWKWSGAESGVSPGRTWPEPLWQCSDSKLSFRLWALPKSLVKHYCHSLFLFAQHGYFSLPSIMSSLWHCQSRIPSWVAPSTAVFSQIYAKQWFWCKPGFQPQQWISYHLNYFYEISIYNDVTSGTELKILKTLRSQNKTRVGTNSLISRMHPKWPAMWVLSAKWIIRKKKKQHSDCSVVQWSLIAHGSVDLKQFHLFNYLRQSLAMWFWIIFNALCSQG